MGCCEARSEDYNSNYFLSYTSTKKIDFNPLFSVKSEYIHSELPTGPDSIREEAKMKEEFLEKNEGESPYIEPVRANGNIDPRNFKTLQFKVIDGKYLEVSTTIKITPYEINDKTPFQEGKYYFGKDPNSNDYVFPQEENVGHRQFEVRFDKNTGLYYIKDIREGTGSFIKIHKKQVIDQDSIFSFCNTHIFVYKVKSDNLLKFKFLIGSLKNKMYTFDPKENKVVRIGRSKQSEVLYKDESVSRFQLSFVYDNGKWFICDGVRDKISTNGLWKLASKKVAFHDHMIFKSGNTTFKVTLV